MERCSLFAVRITLILLLLKFCYPCLGQIMCPSACQCVGLSATCHGDNGTLPRVVQDLPAVLESFEFTVFTQSMYTKNHIDLNTIQGLGKFKNLRNFQIQPYVLSAPITYNSKPRADIFCNWTQLEEIHLNMHSSYEDIGSMEPFSCLQHLKVLDLSYSRMVTDTGLHRLLSTRLSRHITTLLLRNIQKFDRDETVKIYFSSLFSNLNRSSLEVIDLSANAVRVCYPGLFLFPNLKKLDLSENLLFFTDSQLDFTFLIEAVLHPSLQEVSVADPSVSLTARSGENSVFLFERFTDLLSSCSHISKISPQFTSDEQLQLCSMLRQHTYNTKNSSQCLYGLQIPLGGRLELFNVSGVTNYHNPYLNHMPRGRFCFYPENTIHTIDVSNNRAAHFYDNPTLSNMSISGLTRLKTFNLVNNDFMLERFQLFDDMPSLEQLLLGGNKVQIHLDSKNELFKFLGNLSHLDLSRNELHVVPHAEFAHLSKLEHLDLSDNELGGLNIQLPDTSSLKMLNLSTNGITCLHASMVDQFDRYPLLEVDLQGNAFICSCDALWFVRWVQTTSTRLTRKSVLNCYTEEGLRTITNINLKEFYNRCHPMSQLEVALISVSAALCFFLLVLGLLVMYRQRWRIRHYLYRLRLRQERAVLNDDYEYDAYVSYSDCPEVRRWVSGVMHEELECKRGLKLFIHQRDLLGGGFFLERIDAAMRKCRKTILVLSPEFLQSRTCLYEAWSAHTSMVTENRDAVVLVKLQPLPLAGITGTLASLMQIRDCLDWTNDPIGQHLFWEQLEDIILSVLDTPILD